MNLAELFIVSDVLLESEKPQEESVCAHGENFSGMLIEVRNAEGVKCPRCWMHSTKANEEGLCPRCAAVVAEMDLSE